MDKVAERLPPLGLTRWFSSEEDGGPDVGQDFMLPDGSRLYFGEVSNLTLDETGVDEIPKGHGWVILHETKDGSQNCLGFVAQVVHETDAIAELARAMNGEM